MAICNLTAAKVVKYGKVWKILGLELAHKEGEIFGNRIMVPGAPQLLSGIVWSPENSCDTPESVAAWATVCVPTLLCAMPPEGQRQTIYTLHRPIPACARGESESPFAVARKRRMRSRHQRDLISGISER